MQVAESVTVGALAAGIGLAVGILLSVELSRPLSALDATTDGVALDGWVIGKALGTGTLVATVAAMAAARRIGVLPSAVQAKRRWPAALGAVVAIAASVLLLVHGSLLAAFAALLTLCVAHMLAVLPATVALLRRGIGAWPSRIALRLNLRSASIHAGKIGFALGALSLATAAAIGMGVMVESLRQDFLAMLEQRLPPGIYVAGVPESADLAALGASLESLAEDEVHIQRPGRLRARVDEGAVELTFVRIDASEAARYGLQRGLQQRVMVNEPGSRRLGVAAGDTLRLVADGRARTVEVAHVFRDFGAPTPRIVAPETLAADFPGAPIRYDRLFVRTSAQDRGAIAQALRQRWPDSRVQDQGQLRALAEEVFDASFVVAAGLSLWRWWWLRWGSMAC